MTLLEALLILGQGFLSGVWPLANAEILAGALTAYTPDGWPLLLAVVVLSAGHTLGKVSLFVAFRRGVRTPGGDGRVARRIADIEGRVESYAQRGPWLVALLCFVTSAVGLPPLLLMTFVLARTSFPVGWFAATVLVGRVVRFGAIAFGVGLLVG